MINKDIEIVPDFKESLIIVCIIGLKDLGKNTPIALEKLLNLLKQLLKILWKILENIYLKGLKII